MKVVFELRATFDKVDIWRKEVEIEEQEFQILSSGKTKAIQILPNIIVPFSPEGLVFSLSQYSKSHFIFPILVNFTKVKLPEGTELGDLPRLLEANRWVGI